jgi:TolB protein
MNSDGTNQVNLSNNRAFEGNPSWSPDGKYIFFASVADPHSYSQIYRMDSDGSNRIKISGDQLFESRSPVVSPDGKRIAFYSRDGGAIYLMNIDGTNIVKLAVGKSNPVWSPDGKRIASKGGSSIYITTVENGNTFQLLDDSTVGSTLTWSPNGNQIAFEAALPNQNLRSQIYVMNADGTNRVNLSNNQFDEIHPAWSPVPVIINNFPIELTPAPTWFFPESENLTPNSGTLNAEDRILHAQATDVLSTVTAQAKIEDIHLRMTQTAFQSTAVAKPTKH